MKAQNSIITGRAIIPALVTIIAIGAGILFLPDHIRRAMIYRKASIDDYKTFQNRAVEPGTPQPWALSADYNAKPIPPDFLEYMDGFDTIAYLVVRDGKIMHEEYRGGHTEASISGSFSVAKSIVALLVGIALDEGKINSIGQPVGDFIPAYASGDRSKITIGDLLTMSSGLGWDEAYSSLVSITTKAYFGSDLGSLVGGLAVADVPGKRFTYKSCDTQLLGEIVEKATGKRLAEYASEKLWKTLGAGASALWSLDRAGGMEKAFCCFNSTARDFARIGQMVLDGGTWRGKRIVSAKYVRSATSPASWLIDDEGKAVDYYGYQFWIIRHRGMVIPYMRGIKGQYVFIIPARNAVVVRLGKNRSDVMINHASEDAYRYIDLALELME